MPESPRICGVELIYSNRMASPRQIRALHTQHLFGRLAVEVDLIGGDFLTLSKGRLRPSAGRVFPLCLGWQAINFGPHFLVEPFCICKPVQI